MDDSELIAGREHARTHNSQWFIRCPNKVCGREWHGNPMIFMNKNDCPGSHYYEPGAPSIPDNWKDT